MAHGATGYEKSDANLLKVLVIALGSILLIVTCLVFVQQAYVLYTEKFIAERLYKPQSPLLLEVRAAEQETLTTYKVLDARQGRYQIPIKRAMELIIKEAGK